MRPTTKNRALLLLLLLLIAVPPQAGAGPQAEEPPSEPAPQLHIRRRSGLPPPDEDSMRAWHIRYTEQAEPVKAALADLLRARRRLRPAKLGPHCRRLATAIDRFWVETRRHRVLPVADAAADLHLKRLYLRLDDAAESCAAGRWAETDDALRRAGLAWRQAALALGRWELEP